MSVDLGTYLKEKRSPLAEHVPTLMSAANKYRVDPRFIVAVAGAESSFGRISKGHNAWGIGPHYRYGSWEEGINAAAKLLRTYYIDEGRRSVQAIQQKWAPIAAANDPTNLNSNWVRNVKTIYSALGGDPNDVTKGWRKGAAPKAVAKLPSQQPPAPAPTAPPELEAVKMGQIPLLERTAFENLGRIARGESPTRTLRSLTEAAMLEAASKAAAQVTVAETQPKVSNRVTTEDSLTAESIRQTDRPKVGPLKPGGGWGGSYNVAKSLADIGKQLGLTAVSEKRDTRSTKSGGVSDHWVGSKDAYAFDLSNGGSPTPEMDEAAKRIAAQLGIKYDGKSELVATVTRNGYRIQLLYRTQVGGNHNDHLHLGVRKV